MASRIKGITVEIGGDTTGLEKALKSVNGTIRNTQSQLKDVTKLLKLDPKNTELLSQYYGIDSVNDPYELALYIYGELVDRITVETKSDHNLKDMDFDELEMEEAKAVTRKFLSVLPEQIRERIRGKLDPVTGLISGAGYKVKNLLG